MSCSGCIKLFNFACRKISTSSTNQLLYNQISDSDDKSSENDSDFMYEKLKIRPERNNSLLQKFPATDANSNMEPDHIYSTLKKQCSREADDNDSRDGIDNDDEDAVYATVNFNRNSISVNSDHRMNDGDQHDNQKIITVSNDVHDLYAKIDVNKKKNRK